MAAYNLSGKLSELINNIRTKLIKLISHIEASVDFPDEVDEIPYEEIETDLIEILETINTVMKKASDGNILKHGIKVAIIGKPNVGKSSLFNYLLNTDRAIVTNIPGTTRDILQEYIDIDGIPVILIDTAGIRETTSNNDSDYIESIGVNRSKGAIHDSDLILFIYDINQGKTKEDIEIHNEALKYNKPIIQLANKSDLEDASTHTNDIIIKVSALKGYGIDELKDKIKTIVLGDKFQVQRDEVYINMRHKECLTKAKEHINLANNAVKYREMQDLISIDIKAALLALDEIVGEVVAEEIIDHIFSQFCVGK